MKKRQHIPLQPEPDPHNRIAVWLYEQEEDLTETADYIFTHPETAYQETLSSRCLADFLERRGFQISWNTGGLSTAFTASRGSGRPVIGFLAEYDALPGIGHACGHNLLGTGAAAAACALIEDLESRDAPGTVRVYGCPAEETMSGKIVLNEKGAFQDLDVAVTWHPFDRNRISNDIWQAQDIKFYTFHGVSAHASRSPEAGRSALDAAELMNIGVNYLREHVPDDVRMHYAYIDNGIPANVVPDRAQTNYYIRSSLRSRTEDASRRVDDCARGAAVMTGTSVDIELRSSCREMKVNPVLNRLYYEAMTKIPTPVYTDQELAFVEELSKEAALDNGGQYFGGLCPLEEQPVPISIGTDVSEVSHTVPTITISAATMCRGTALHHSAAARQAGMSIGWKGMLYAARCMAEGTKLLLARPDALEEAWRFHRESSGSPKDKRRCRWANPKNPLYLQYHDEEWGVPVHDDHRLFEMLILESFQAGLSWECVLNKRKAFREAFDDFDLEKVCSYGEEKLSRLQENPGIIRNRQKIHAAVANARIFRSIQEEFGSFSDYLWRWTDGNVIRECGLASSPLSDAISRDLKKRGMKFVGTTIIYAYLQAVGVIFSHEDGCYLAE